MSVNMAKADGVTVYTLTTDPQSSWPPLCQILKGLCYSPVCCSVSQHLRRVQRSSQSVLGTLHIVVGLFNIGLGAILISGCASWYRMDDISFPFWLGGMFMLFGIMSIVSEKRPSPCLVIINVILNVSGVGFAIAAIVLYSINMLDIWVWWMCRQDEYPVSFTPSPGEEIIMNQCLEGKDLVLVLMRGINGVLIVLSVLELCVAISCAVLGIKALRSSEKRDNKSTDDPERYNPLLEEVTSNPTA